MNHPRDTEVSPVRIRSGPLNYFINFVNQLCTMKKPLGTSRASYLFISVFVAFAISAFIAGAQVVRVSPASQTVYLPSDAIVYIEIEGVSGLYGFQLDIEYDPGLMDFNGITEGGFLRESLPSNVFCLDLDTSASGFIDDFACTRSVPGDVSGTGYLAMVNLSSLAASGTSHLNLTGIKLSDVAANPIAFTVENGTIDFTYCTEGENVSCGPLNETGICAFGNATCTGGVLGACVGAVLPEAEVCDGIDNDCSGTIDDIGGGSSISETQCQCYNGTAPGTEGCPHNGIDDDCDGSIDENTCSSPPDDDDGGGGGGGGGGGSSSFGCLSGSQRSCTVTGVCKPSFETCSNGAWGACEGPSPETEICNGIDDDCNGVTDDDGWQ